MTTAPLFELAFDGARCVSVDLRGELDALVAGLHPDEQAYANTLKLRRRRTYAGGRLAARLASGAQSVSPILANHRGAPTLAGGPPLSISHKDALAVGLAGTADHLAVGIDVELAQVRERDISRHVLTEEERRAIADVGGAGLETVLRFSLKEALYKVLDPFKERYIGFKEVEVAPRSDGTVEHRLLLRDGGVPAEIRLSWHRVDDVFVSIATARPAPTRR